MLQDLFDEGLSMDNRDGQGYFIGVIDGKMFFYKGVSYLSIWVFNVGGKSEFSVVFVCFVFGKECNFVVIGKGLELVLLVVLY